MKAERAVAATAALGRKHRSAACAEIKINAPRGLSRDPFSGQGAAINSLSKIARSKRRRGYRERVGESWHKALGPEIVQRLARHLPHAVGAMTLDGQAPPHEDLADLGLALLRSRFGGSPAT
jgi:predicted DNA-binding WGR domain protein